MSVDELIKAKRPDILEAAARHGASNVRLFGSCARGDATGESDVDFLVEMQDGRSLVDFIRLCDALEEILQRKVDVIVEGGISPFIRDRVHAEAVPL